MGRYVRRTDGGCESRVLAIRGDLVLVDARWGRGVLPTYVQLDRAYFERRYGMTPEAAR